MTKRAFAVGCHPDDIEFMMAGTLIQLKEAGYEIHYMNVANGSCGTNQYDRDTIVRMRRQEAIDAAAIIGAIYHESLVDDLKVFYVPEILARMTAVMREVAPEIVLTHGPYDYMEDHVNTGRVAVSSAFFRGMTNADCEPYVKETAQNVTIYHSMPHCISDPLRNPVIPDLYVDITSTMAVKREMLAQHRSQKDWLDVSQGNDAYLDDQAERGRIFGEKSGKFDFAEGWIRHNSVGFCGPDDNPLVDALGDKVLVDPEVAKSKI
jgi:LmbE family N-acetylglucosaminyl deacetylase